MKLLLEVIVSLILHPLAVVLLWINLASRSDLTRATSYCVVCCGTPVSCGGAALFRPLLTRSSRPP